MLNRIELEFPKVEIHSAVTSDKQSHYWYGGEMATIKTSGYTFCIEAIGDVYANLYEMCEDDPEGWAYLKRIKDKSNQGMLGYEVEDYFENDRELYQAMNQEHETYWLDLSDGNWWECFMIDPTGQWHDLMWALDSSLLNEAIEEVLDALKDGLEVQDKFLQLKMFAN